MPEPLSPSVPKLADLVALSAAIEHHQQLPVDVQREMDRELGAALHPLPTRRVEQLRAWAAAVAQRSAEVRRVAGSARAAEQWARLVVLGLGFVFGLLVALGVFYYDGSGRINVLAVLALFVFLPLVLLLPLGLALLPGRAAEALPGVGPLARLLRGMSVGRLAVLSVRVLPRGMRDSLAFMTDTLGAGHRLYRHVEKWAVLAWAQGFAVMFSLAALFALAVLVVFSDLAFGWSTTLDVDGTGVHRLTSLMALPWAWTGWGEPSLALVEASRYYRLDGSQLTTPDPAALGAWWSFLGLSMLCYGLLPRLVILGLCLIGRRRAIVAALLATPGASDVLRRLHAAALAVDSPNSAALTEQAEQDAGLRGGPAEVGTLIVWADAPVDGLVLPSAAGDPQLTRRAGGSSTMAADRAVMEELAALRPRVAVGVVVKAWEPPMGELLDFLRELRVGLGDGVGIVVMPAGEATAAQREAWPRRLASLRDPWLSVGGANAGDTVKEADHA